ncbi:MAG: Glutathione S-transferase, unnamed subgroup [uncultured Rubrobacteraceae bacterium]|uniref:Glutathione S-transferase, unnamed subgroup n=1 Tax=uncultured Rubrobacteraceae bacterium TaxID=349277 RepID=A0A6J4QZ62_9ACTN|nr:MAG: Glutathione S-transferase, unnamed subgroup [uncultured Rubrobacteraceae bacterium]
MIRLHDNLSSGNGYKVRLLLARLDTPFERVEYDIQRVALLLTHPIGGAPSSLRRAPGQASMHPW